MTTLTQEALDEIRRMSACGFLCHRSNSAESAHKREIEHG